MIKPSYQESRGGALAITGEFVSMKMVSHPFVEDSRIHSLKIHGNGKYHPVLDIGPVNPRSSKQACDSGCAEAQAKFDQQYPQFSKTKKLFEQLRRTEFRQLDQGNCTYLDYTGAALPPQSLLDNHFKFLKDNLLGNPHSAHEPSLRASHEDQAARDAVLSFCNADPSVYTVVWTANSSAAIKVVAQSYPFSKKGAFVYAPDCHNSVLGISEFAKSKGAAVQGFKFGKNWTSSYDYDELED
eukprot:2758803-Rhodomonas_salina.1